MADAMLYVVGLGPGDARYLTAQAQTALQAADVLCGYTVYIDLVRPLYPDKEVYTTGMTKEIDRCRWALETAQSGKTVALVCSGDAGVYGMASPLLELAQGYPSVTVEIVPGLTAALSGGGGAGRSIGARFLCDLPFGSAHARGTVIEKSAGLRGDGGLLCGTVQPVLQGPGRSPAKGRADLTAKRQGTADDLRHACATLAARGRLLAC